MLNEGACSKIQIVKLTETTLKHVISHFIYVDPKKPPCLETISDCINPMNSDV